MRLLLDTHVLLWVLLQPGRLDRQTLQAIEEKSNEVLFSAATIWEIAIKAGFRRSDFTVDPRTIVHAALDTGFVELSVTADTAVMVAGLPRHHRDPFDRLLVAQAICEPARLLTADRALMPYSELVTIVQLQ